MFLNSTVFFEEVRNTQKCEIILDREVYKRSHYRLVSFEISSLRPCWSLPSSVLNPFYTSLIFILLRF